MAFDPITEEDLQDFTFEELQQLADDEAEVLSSDGSPGEQVADSDAYGYYGE